MAAGGMQGPLGVRRQRIERIKTSRKRVRSDPPGKFKRTFYRVVIARIRVACARARANRALFLTPLRGCREDRKHRQPSYLGFIAFNGARPFTTCRLLSGRGEKRKRFLVAERSSGSGQNPPDVLLGPGHARPRSLSCCAARGVCTFIRTFIRGVIRIIKIPALSGTTPRRDAEFRAVSSLQSCDNIRNLSSARQCHCAYN